MSRYDIAVLLVVAVAIIGLLVFLLLVVAQNE